MWLRWSCLVVALPVCGVTGQPASVDLAQHAPQHRRQLLGSDLLAGSGVQSTPAPLKVQAWTCTACRTNWAITTVNPSPQPFFDHLAATVEQLGAARSMLRQVCALADDVATITDQQLRDRLLALASCAR
jgi:hypothetical protein